jgi:aminopeptidase C
MLGHTRLTGPLLGHQAKTNSLLREGTSSIWKKSCIFFAASALMLNACGPQLDARNAKSSVDSVEIPQTPVENQDRVGFCWAYAAIGLIESDLKLRTGPRCSFRRKLSDSIAC